MRVERNASIGDRMRRAETGSDVFRSLPHKVSLPLSEMTTEEVGASDSVENKHSKLMNSHFSSL